MNTTRQRLAMAAAALFCCGSAAAATLLVQPGDKLAQHGHGVVLQATARGAPANAATASSGGLPQRWSPGALLR